MFRYIPGDMNHSGPFKKVGHGKYVYEAWTTVRRRI